jgi:hypothetical protein
MSQRSRFKEVGATLARALDLLPETPGRDCGMVTIEQHGGNGLSAPLARTGVVGAVQERTALGITEREAVLGRAVLVPEDAGLQASDGVDHEHGGEFATGDHEVTDAHFLEPERVDRALVDAFVVTAHEHDAR